MKIRRTPGIGGVAVLMALTAAIASPLLVRAGDKALLTPEKPIVIPGGAGGYDWMAVDAGERRLLAAHKGKGTLVVLDLKNEKDITSIPVGAAQGIAVDEADNKYFVGDEEEHKVVVLDRKTLKVTAEIPVTGPVDAIGFDPKRGMVYADHDDGKDVWVIDAKTDKIVGTVAISGAPEWIEYDAATDRLYQNIKTDDSVQVINPEKRTVEAVWKTAPATGPHGLAILSQQGRLVSAGKNGILAVLDIATGKVLETVNIGQGVDQIVYDAMNKRVYCGCKGVISVVQIKKKKGSSLLANIPQPNGAHTLAVDPTTGAVWVSYADATESYLQKFTP